MSASSLVIYFIIVGIALALLVLIRLLTDSGGIDLVDFTGEFYYPQGTEDESDLKHE